MDLLRDAQVETTGAGFLGWWRVFAFIVVLAILIGGSALSLKLNPWVKCSKCKDKRRIKGWVASCAHHIRSQCKGTGQELRFGRKFLFGERVPPHQR